MFNYYGSKSKIVHLYPSPKFDRVIEPFAGSARYALKYWDRDVILVDKYEVIIKVWRWLQQAKKKDVLGLPFLKKGEMIPESIMGAERAFLGFVVCDGAAYPQQKTTHYSSGKDKVAYRLTSIANNLHKIRHWDIRCEDYRTIPNQDATWFVDPPYQHGGHRYKHSGIDYEELKNWCQSRQGQVVACENTKADWMTFWPVTEMKGQKNKTNEAVWSNYRTGYEVKQLELF